MGHRHSLTAVTGTHTHTALDGSTITTRSDVRYPRGATRLPAINHPSPYPTIGAPTFRLLIVAAFSTAANSSIAFPRHRRKRYPRSPRIPQQLRRPGPGRGEEAPSASEVVQIGVGAIKKPRRLCLTGEPGKITVYRLCQILNRLCANAYLDRGFSHVPLNTGRTRQWFVQARRSGSRAWRSRALHLRNNAHRRSGLQP